MGNSEPPGAPPRDRSLTGTGTGPAFTAIRRLLQAGAFAFLAVAAVRAHLGLSFDTCETFCPFGGAEGILYLLREKQYLCVLSESNVALFLGVLVLSLAGRRLFCGSLCPLGFLSELLHSLRGRLKLKALLPSPRVDRALKLVRYGVLAAVIWATMHAGDLVFRGYDPYFALFSLHGHGILWTSYLALGAVLVGALLSPSPWCRWLCPLGACLDAGGAVSVLSVKRDAGPCTGCGACERACPQAIPVASRDKVADTECTLCLACAGACRPGALALCGPFPGRAVSPWILPSLVGLFLALTFVATPLFKVPTLERSFNPTAAAAEAREAQFIVAGLTCKGRSLMIYESLRYLPGVRSMKTFAREHRLVVEYDGRQLAPEDIRSCLAGSMRDPETGEESAPFTIVRSW